VARQGRGKCRGEGGGRRGRMSEGFGGGEGWVNLRGGGCYGRRGGDEDDRLGRGRWWG
jgi:hypothetical protein